MPRGSPGVLNPLRDTQQDIPACYCKRCGGEVYSWETLYTWGDKRICSDCFEAVVTAWLKEAPKEVAAALDVETETVFGA